MTTMADYRSAVDVEAPAAQLFDYLADVSNLPRYFERMTSATPAAGNAIQVTAEVDGRKVVGEAWFTVDRDRQQLSWGAEGPNDYHGRLQVTGTGDSSQVTVTVSTARAEGQQIQDGVDETVASVKRLVEQG